MLEALLIYFFFVLLLLLFLLLLLLLSNIHGVADILQNTYKYGNEKVIQNQFYIHLTTGLLTLVVKKCIFPFFYQSTHTFRS